MVGDVLDIAVEFNFKVYDARNSSNWLSVKTWPPKLQLILFNFANNTSNEYRKNHLQI